MTLSEMFRTKNFIPVSDCLRGWEERRREREITDFLGEGELKNVLKFDCLTVERF